MKLIKVLIFSLLTILFVTFAHSVQAAEVTKEMPLQGKPSVKHVKKVYLPVEKSVVSLGAESLNGLTPSQAAERELKRSSSSGAATE